MNQGISKNDLASFIRAHDFSKLFIELGWDQEGLPSAPLFLSLPHGETFPTRVVAEKHGFAVCVCDARENYPARRGDRRRLVNELAKHYYEHLLILLGGGKQRWIVAIRPQNRPMRTVEVEWHEHQDVQSLVEKLTGIFFDISDEEHLGLTDVVNRVRGAFMENAEKVTRKFYGEFQKELSAFAEFITGIRDQISREWYAALMLNRLMFIYFIQKKGFLDGDHNYLEKRLQQTQEQFGKDEFDRKFYRHFLRKLFAQGLGTPEAQRDPALKEMLGEVPYLNGGLFDVHEIEKENKDIEIPDAAFERLFAFFGKYRWHLDTRATATGKDINPDVIGYIFEKYINDRSAMGAYYTREDITGYISRNTIIPFLLHRAREKCKNAFDPQNGIWRFLRENPDNYIYLAVRKGCNIPDEEIPGNIRYGLDTQATEPEAPNLLKRRKDWNTTTENRFALPTEIWRETIVRRQRYFALRDKIARGEICEIDDLITYNLDIERFASDALHNYEGSDFIAAFYEAIAGRKALKSNDRETRGITVLDPACGSGAFLFAALNILEPLYQACIERMEDFVDEDEQLREQGKRKGTKKYPQFRAVLDDIATHQNPRYWIYKTIILNNLYGVDLMKEAAEIAKLRLFLKLAAEAEYDSHKDNLGLEPLPDIDFNIRSGNSLVGFASMTQFEQAVSTDPQTGQMRMDYSELTDEIREQAAEVQTANQAFRYAQDEGSEDYQAAKQELSKRLAVLNDRMNRYLAEQYGKGKDGYKKWLQSHQPFHWLAEFYGIIEEDGGFGVVIGNPPYVEYSKIKKTYEIKGYMTETCRNIYAYFVERGISITGKTKQLGMIVPISLVSTPRTETVRRFLETKCSSVHLSNYADRPGTLFNGVHQKLSIVITSNKRKRECKLLTTNFLHWSSSHERTTLFDKILYHEIRSEMIIQGRYPKIGLAIEQTILEKIRSKSQSILSLMSIKRMDSKPLYLNMRLMFWVKCFIAAQKSGEFKSFYPLFSVSEKELLTILNSNTFFWFWEIVSDCWHLTNKELDDFSIAEKELDTTQKKALFLLSNELTDDLDKNKKFVGTIQTDYEYYHKKSKHIIDEIDVILADHYGFTEEELDYIINYDIKYRMGLNSKDKK